MSEKDLIVLAADKDLESTLHGLLPRNQSLGIRAITFDIIVDSQHDPACAQRGVGFLSIFSRQYSHGLLIFDHQGSGREIVNPRALQAQLNGEFAASAWGERARAIVLSPELEAWVWSNSPLVDDVVGWRDQPISLKDWLTEQGLLKEGEGKPTRPKEAFQAALYQMQTRRSASLYRQLAEKVSFRRCQDAAFLELRTILSDWFPAE